MGIRNLNKFLQKNASSAIEKKLLFSLKNKKIVIDANNYLYRFLCNGELIPNLYEFCVLLKYYNIEAIFVFDGYPPEEKMKIIEKRRQLRKEAKEKYDEMCVANKDTNYHTKEFLNLKKQAMYLSSELIVESKKLLNHMGIETLIAPSEADEYCSFMVNNDKVYACMSEDMDMFVYGCKRVIRYVSILNHTCVVYTMESILKELTIRQEEFVQLCILSGTDYNKELDNIYSNYKVFQEYKNNINNKNNISFCNWLNLNNYISNLNITNIMKLFEIKNTERAYSSKIKADNDKTIFEFLEKYNFIFPIMV